MAQTKKINPFDQARNLLSQVGSSVGSYFNPTSNGGNNFWGAKPVQNTVNILQKQYNPQSYVQPVKSFAKGVGNMSTMGLVSKFDQQNPDRFYRAGQFAGLINPLNPVNKVMGAANVGGRVVSRIAPQATSFLAKRIIPGIVSEGLQTAGYTGAQQLAGATGIGPKIPLTKENILPNLLVGLGARGVFSKLAPGTGSALKQQSTEILDSQSAKTIAQLRDKIARGKSTIEDVAKIRQLARENLKLPKAVFEKMTPEDMSKELGSLLDRNQRYAFQQLPGYMGFAGKNQVKPVTQERIPEVSVKQSSQGNIYIKNGNNVVTGIPKTVQNDIYEGSLGNIPTPERRLKANSFLNKQGLELDAQGKIVSQPQTGGVGAVGGEVKVPESPQSVLQKTNLETKPPVISSPELPAGGGGQTIAPPSSSSNPIIPPSNQLGAGNPVQRIIEALQTAKPLEAKQGEIYHQIKSQQAGALSGIGQGMKGEQGYYQKLGQLKGELPKVEFESIRKQLSQDDVNQVFNMVEKSNLGTFEKVNAQTALKKLLGAEGGSVPTKSELVLLNEVFPPEFIQAVMGKRPFIQKLFALGEEGLNLPRAMMSTLDLSAPLRQGIFLVGRPKQWLPAFKDMFKYAFNEKSYLGLTEEIKARPTYKLMREAKLSLTDTNPLPGSREEAFMSNLSEKIPGFGRLAKASNQAYSGFLNKLRADTFDSLVTDAQKQGIKVEGKVLEDIGKFVNSATGRGDIGALSRLAPVMNGLFFSPRLMMSRINMLNPHYYATLDPFVRKEALKSLVGFAGTAMTVLGLAKLGGAEVGADPRSADFGKIKVGNTRYDILGGFQQYIKFGTQMLTGQRISTTTGKLMTVGEGFNAPTRKDIAMSFLESKEAPVASLITALLSGKTAIGEDVRLAPEVINRFIPMILQGVADLTDEYGAKGVIAAIPGMFGAGSQTYGKQNLVQGENQLGQPTSQLKAPTSIGEKIADRVLGQPVLGTTPQYSADAYYKQMLKMPKAQAAQKFDEIAKTNPELAKKIIQSAKDYKLGVTPADETLKTKGVASGDRTVAIKKEFDKLKTPQEKAKLWDEYVKKGIITKEVAQQLTLLMKGGQ